jgi:hypothetical protein
MENSMGSMYFRKVGRKRAETDLQHVQESSITAGFCGNVPLGQGHQKVQLTEYKKLMKIT